MACWKILRQPVQYQFRGRTAPGIDPAYLISDLTQCDLLAFHMLASGTSLTRQAGVHTVISHDVSSLQRRQVDVGHIGAFVAQQTGHREVGIQFAHAALN